MPIRLFKRKAVLSGEVDVETAETLHAWLIEAPGRTIDLGGCTHIHPACVQVVLASGAPVLALPADADLHGWLAPLFSPD
ncbi:hypothetical protein GVO57_00910 [Sphingomonas changnyeongensis]|uniref:STAS domain-containing protein n=1 Tax=Sphingomonas changnyeongensis TaxID=2698679 RepID=A0A7Z2S436_9SPHN|nr:hypothetical protein [Sphingomonas changnyeongensis]QHL89640.1 hypothetical protein GVO57_00910 [Sphingomonas changnyeongensis]